MRKKVLEKGITDIPTRDGHGKELKSYQSWRDMLRRCYDPKLHKVIPSYVGCTVCGEWLLYSTFKRWYDIAYVEGFALDKDLLVEGNKQYGPTTCRYVPQALNNLFLDRGRSRGGYPTGVYYSKRDRKFIALLSINGALTYLGGFTTPEEASQAYLTAKKKYCTKEANKYLSEGAIGRDLYLALIRKIDLL